MNDLNLIKCTDFIKSLISKHIQADIELLPRDEMDGHRGRAIWGNGVTLPVIQLQMCITAKEIEQSLMQLAVRGEFEDHPKLIEHAGMIDNEMAYLEHLVLHEVAHLKNDWHQDQETECDLWVYDQMLGNSNN